MSNARQLAVGDLVVTDYARGEETVVRRVTAVVKDGNFGSGARASADDGGACSHCHRSFGTKIHNVDSSWFLPAAGGGAQ